MPVSRSDRRWLKRFVSQAVGLLFGSDARIDARSFQQYRFVPSEEAENEILPTRLDHPLPEPPTGMSVVKAYPADLVRIVVATKYDGLSTSPPARLRTLLGRWLGCRYSESVRESPFDWHRFVWHGPRIDHADLAVMADWYDVDHPVDEEFAGRATFVGWLRRESKMTAGDAAAEAAGRRRDPPRRD